MAFIVSSAFIVISFVLFKDSAAFVYQGGMIIFSLASTILLGTVLTYEKVIKS